LPASRAPGRSRTAPRTPSRRSTTSSSSIDRAVPYLHEAVMLTTADSNWQTEVVGTSPDYFALRSMRVAAGDPFDANSDDKVVVLGDTVVAQLFGAGQSPIGELVRIKNVSFTIIGVLAHQGRTPEGQDLDDVAIVPAEVFMAKIDSKIRFGGAVLVSPVSARVEGELRTLLRDRHRLAPGDDDDFVIRDPTAQ
jgi:putative ABC transport system permease protein